MKNTLFLLFTTVLTFICLSEGQIQIMYTQPYYENIIKEQHSLDLLIQNPPQKINFETFALSEIKASDVEDYCTNSLFYIYENNECKAPTKKQDCTNGRKYIAGDTIYYTSGVCIDNCCQYYGLIEDNGECKKPTKLEDCQAVKLNYFEPQNICVKDCNYQGASNEYGSCPSNIENGVTCKTINGRDDCEEGNNIAINSYNGQYFNYCVPDCTLVNFDVDQLFENSCTDIIDSCTHFFLDEFIFMTGTNKCFTNKNYCFALGLVLEINEQVTNPTSVVKGDCRAPKNAAECKYSLNYLSYFLEGKEKDFIPNKCISKLECLSKRYVPNIDDKICKLPQKEADCLNVGYKFVAANQPCGDKLEQELNLLLTEKDCLAAKGEWIKTQQESYCMKTCSEQNSYWNIQTSSCVEKDKCPNKISNDLKICGFTNCQPEYGISPNDDNLCLKCPNNCLSCSSSQTCDICKEGFGLSSKEETKGQCLTCKSSGCSDCLTNYLECSSCQHGFVQNTTDKSCAKCSIPNCNTCAIDKLNVCKSCQSNYFPVTNEENIIQKCISEQEKLCQEAQSEDSIKEISSFNDFTELNSYVEKVGSNCQSSFIVNEEVQKQISSEVTSSFVNQFPKEISNGNKDKISKDLITIAEFTSSSMYDSSNNDEIMKLISNENLKLTEEGIQANLEILDKLINGTKETYEAYSSSIGTILSTSKSQWIENKSKSKFSMKGENINIFYKNGNINQLFSSSSTADTTSEENGIKFSIEAKKKLIEATTNNSLTIMLSNEIYSHPLQKKQQNINAKTQVFKYHISLLDENSVIKPYQMKDLSEPLEITLPQLNETVKLNPQNGFELIACYWNGQKWSKDGIVITKVNSNSIDISTTHLSEFVILEEKITNQAINKDDESSDDNILLIVLISVGAFIGCSLIALLVFCYIKIKKNSAPQIQDLYQDACIKQNVIPNDLENQAHKI